MGTSPVCCVAAGRAQAWICRQRGVMCEGLPLGLYVIVYDLLCGRGRGLDGAPGGLHGVGARLGLD